MVLLLSSQVKWGLLQFIIAVQANASSTVLQLLHQVSSLSKRSLNQKQKKNWEDPQLDAAEVPKGLE